MELAYKGPRTDLKPDKDAIWRFLTWWFRECTKGQIEIGWMNAIRGDLTEFRRFDIEDEDIVEFVSNVNSIPGQSVYFRASTIDPDAPPGHTKDDHVIQSPGTWADLDSQEDVERAQKVTSLVRPNAWVTTGRHPHTRYQLFVRTEEPITEQAQIKAINKRMIKLYGGDRAVSNPSRLMRLAGTIAYPWKKNRTEVELTSLSIPEDNRQKSYPIATLLTQLPVDDGVAEQQERTGIRATLNTVSEYVHRIRSGEGWRDNMLRLTAHWIGRGWSDTEIALAVESLPKPDWRDKIDWRDVEKAIATGRQKWGVPDREEPIGPAPTQPFPEHVTDPWDTLQPPVFPIHVLPGVLREFVESRARVMGADPCALAWSCLSACSAAMDGQTRLKLKRHDSWSVPPPIWVALVGASSAKKTPIIQAAWSPLEDVQKVALRGYANQVSYWKSQPKESRGDEPPKPKRLVSHDATMEGVQEILSRQDRGLGLLRDELAGFIGAMDKYSGNGRGGAADRAFFLQSYNGGPHVVDRVGRGTVPVDNLLLTICGGIQPDRLAQFADLADDGLWQRFVPIIVGQSELGTDEAPGPEVEAYKLRVETLIDASKGAIASLSEGAHAVRERLEREMFELERAAPLSGKFASFVGKMPGLFGRLCLVLSYLEPSGLGYIVSERTADAARVLITRCVIPHAAQVYLTMGGDNGGLDVTQAIAGFILAKKMDRIIVSDLTRNVRVCRNRSVGEVAKQVSPLVAGGWITPETDLPNNKAWLVNPAVHSIFAERARSEMLRRSMVRDIISCGEEAE